MPHHPHQYPHEHERMLLSTCHRSVSDGNLIRHNHQNITSSNGRFENNRALHEMQRMIPRNSAIGRESELQFSRSQKQPPRHNTNGTGIHHGKEEFIRYRSVSISVPVSGPAVNYREIVHQDGLLVNESYANAHSDLKGTKQKPISGICSQLSNDLDGRGRHRHTQVFQRERCQARDPPVSVNNKVYFKPDNSTPTVFGTEEKEVRQEAPPNEKKEDSNSRLTTTTSSKLEQKYSSEDERKTSSSHESNIMATVSTCDEKPLDIYEIEAQNQNQSSSSAAESEEAKEPSESREKELVNGALLALVSLASGTPSSSTDKSRKVDNDNGAINTGTSTPASPPLLRSNEVETPPPPQNINVSTITPSSSAATFQSLNNRYRLNTSISTSSVSERSDLSHASCPNGQVDRSIEYTQQMSGTIPSAPPHHPLSLPERRRHSSLPCVQESRSEHIPVRYTRDIPVPKLEASSFTSQPRYTLMMKRDPDNRDERYYMDDSSMHPQYVHVDRIRAPGGPMGRPTRFSSEPVRYSRHVYRSETAPPLPRMADEYPLRANERVVTDFSGNYGVEVIKCMDDRRASGVIMHEHLGGGYDNSRSRVASRDDYEETRQPFHATRHPSEDAYYSQSDRYLSLPNRERAVSLSSPSFNSMIQPSLSRDRKNQEEVRVQFVRPDHLDPRTEVVLGKCASFSPRVDYPLSPYHPPTYHPHREGNTGVKKTILRRKCAWKNYPELEKFLIENREEYLKHSAKNYTVEQKQYNNRLTERLLEVAAKHNYVFDPMDFNFVGVRDRIRCYYKSYVQSNKKRGVIVGYDATGGKKKPKHEDNSNTKVVQKEKSSAGEITKESKKD